MLCAVGYMPRPALLRKNRTVLCWPKEGGRRRYVNEGRSILFCSGNRPGSEAEKIYEDSASVWAGKEMHGCQLQTKICPYSPRLSE